MKSFVFTHLSPPSLPPFLPTHKSLDERRINLRSPSRERIILPSAMVPLCSTSQPNPEFCTVAKFHPSRNFFSFSFSFPFPFPSLDKKENPCGGIQIIVLTREPLPTRTTPSLSLSLSLHQIDILLPCTVLYCTHTIYPTYIVHK